MLDFVEWLVYGVFGLVGVALVMAVLTVTVVLPIEMAVLLFQLITK